MYFRALYSLLFPNGWCNFPKLLHHLHNTWRNKKLHDMIWYVIKYNSPVPGQSRHVFGARCGGARRPSPGGRHSRVAWSSWSSWSSWTSRERGRAARRSAGAVVVETGETVNASYASAYLVCVVAYGLFNVWYWRNKPRWLQLRIN